MTAARSEVAAERGLRPIRIGISACLLGKRVRFDGGHKRDVFLTEGFGRFVEWVPVCPEVEAGFGIPREPMRLVRIEPGMRLLTVKTGIDLTERLQRFSRMRASALAREDLSGYLLKKDSPSCGLERVRVYERHGSPTRGGRGLFAAALVEAFPHLPVEEEGRLADPRLRDNFVERVFAYWRVRGLSAAPWTVGDLVHFHTAHKLLLLAHAPDAYRRLGRLVAGAGGMSRQDLQRRYVDGFMQALAQLATAQRHTNVLQHMAGYFKNRLNAMSKRELAETITDYRRGLVPLVVPLTLVRHHVRTLEVTYLAGQTYLEPHPKELMLRNHV
jgi:uncharacterized protein YbgA (DUF1722 family)/uncharacterized protein YbbK (DUF523 family)